MSDGTSLYNALETSSAFACLGRDDEQMWNSGARKLGCARLKLTCETLKVVSDFGQPGGASRQTVQYLVDYILCCIY